MIVMIKRLLYISMALAGMLLALSCQREVWIENNEAEQVPEGYVKIDFTADVPVMEEVVTRAVDIDGGGITSMTLFCFDRYGLFITIVEATVPDAGGLSGNFSATVPAHTRRVHFLANQNMKKWGENHDIFRGRSESEVMAIMESSSGRMVYWARFEAPEGQDFGTALKTTYADVATTTNIKMIRNHAFVSIKNDQTNTSYFTTTGFAICNTMAYGTVAPYHSQLGFDFTWPEDITEVTLPKNKSKITDVTDVTTTTTTTTAESLFGQFVFECENRQDDPVSVILKGYNKGETADNAKYYRVMLQSTNGTMIQLIRNHRYNIVINGKLDYGQDSFEDALKAPATNNIWISVSDDIKKVADETNILSVAQTSYILTGSENTGFSLNVHYNLEKQSGSVTSADKPEVSWLGTGEPEVAYYSNFTGDDHDFLGQNYTTAMDYDVADYNGEITLTLKPQEGDPKHEGTLLVKAGQLQRKIKVITINQQSFYPVWVSSQVYGGSISDINEATRAHATIMFTVPETCPEEMFPMKVLISVNKLDVRAASGLSLPVVKYGDEDYFGEEATDSDGTKIGYKYVFEVEKPGVQRVYFENKLVEPNGTKSKVTIEAEHFQTMYKEVTFQDTQYSIFLDLPSYTAPSLDQGATDEPVRYYLVPQKKNAEVDLSVYLHKGQTTATSQPDAVVPNMLSSSDSDTGYNEKEGYEATGTDADDAGKCDEFLFFSNHLEMAVSDNSDVAFKLARRDLWTTNGRTHLVWVKNWDTTTDGEYPFNVKFYTNRAKSAEPIRVSSNDTKFSYINIPDGKDVSTTPYNRPTFRSTVFELANYRPFRFAAKISDNGGAYQGTTKMYDPINDTEVDDVLEGYEEITDDVILDYAEAGKEVKISFDVTSFQSTPQVAGETSVSVNPFGTPFEIYIDAPMLSLPENVTYPTVVNEKGVSVAKLRADENVPGRFIYTVDRQRAEEKNSFVESGNSTPLISDGKAATGDQTNERKTLTFITNSVVNKGDITISSNEEQIVYFKKSFQVDNNPITGTITFGGQSIPSTGFVAFESETDNTRFGSIKMTGNGTYSLILRKEYEGEFKWDTPIIITYERLDVTPHEAYSKKYPGGLEELLSTANPTIELVKE